MKVAILAAFSLIALCFPAVMCLAQAEAEDPLAPEIPAPSLRGTLTVEELVGSASIQEGAHTVKINVINNGKRALLLDGDNVEFISGQDKQGALSKEQLISPPAKNTLPGDVLELASSVASGGVMPVLVDAANKAKNPGPAFYGKDEARRDLDEMRFGKRLVFPGENSSGELYLGKSATRPGQLSIQVYSHPDGQALGKLRIPVNTIAPSAVPKTASSEKDTGNGSAEAQRLPSQLEKELFKRQKKEGKL